jgi:hypothetical protein
MLYNIILRLMPIIEQNKQRAASPEHNTLAASSMEAISHEQESFSMSYPIAVLQPYTNDPALLI